MGEFVEFRQPVHFGGVREVHGDPYGNSIISIGQDDGRLQKLNETDLSDAANSNLDKLSDDNLCSASFCSDHKTLICGGNSKILYKVNWPEASNIKTIITLPDSIVTVSCSGRGTLVLVTCQNNKFFVIDYSKSSIIYENSSESDILWAKMSLDAQYFAIYSQNQKLIIYNSTDFSIILEKDILCNEGSLSWGYPSFLVYSSPEESSKFTILDVSQQTEDIFTVTDINLPIKFMTISARDFIAALDNNNEVFVFARPENLNNGKHSIKSQFSKKLEMPTIKCVNWCISSVIGGNEDGEVFKLECSQLTDMQTSAADEIEEPTTQDFLSDKSDNEEEKTEKPKKSITEAFGGLKATMKDTDTVHKKKLTKAKSHAKQQKLDLVAIPKTTTKIKNPKPVKQVDSDEEAAAAAPIIEEDETKNFLSESDEEPQTKAETKPEEVKTKVEVQKPQQNWLDSDEDEESAPPKVPPNSEDRPVDYDEDFNAPPPPTNFSEDEFENSETKSTYTETLSHTFMPGAVEVIGDEEHIVCYNSSAICIQGFKEFGEQCVKVLRVDSIEPFDIIDGRDASNVKYVSMYGPNLIVSSYTSYLLKVYSETGEAIHETRGELADGESAVLVAAGSSFFAIATSLNRLHVLDAAGVVLASLEIEGRLISMAACEEFLIVVSGGLHRFEVFDIDNRKSVAKGLLAGKQPLRWIGFDPMTKEAYIQSGDNIIFKLNDNFGTLWTPVLDLNSELNSNESFYCAYVDDGVIYGYVVEQGKQVPSQIPLPHLMSFRTSPITINSANSSLAVRNPDGTAILERFRDCLVERKFLQAVQVVQLTDDETIHQRALEFALIRGENAVVSRIEEFMNRPKEKDFIFRDKPVKRCELRRTRPPPEIEEEEENEASETETNKSKQQQKQQQEPQRAAIFDISNLGRKKKMISSDDEELLNDLEDVPPPQKSTTKSRKKSQEEETEEREKPKKKKEPKKKRLADDSGSSEEEKEVVEEKEKTKKKKSTKKTSKRLVRSRKPTGIASLSSFGFS